ncbi:MAG: F0F1 ATP synthase subunit A [Candidatus Babeliaceae bacterium]|nr:F0F1 ATP synthase subunit A [Candidatus Babeliaceae bacterium]
MTGFDLFHHIYWQPLSYFGVTNPFFTFQLDLIFSTWFVLFLLLIFSLVGRYALNNPDSLLHTAYMTFARSFTALVAQSWGGYCPEKYFLIITTFFIFILTCNWFMLIGLEEPTANYNTTLALALLSFLYIQKESIKKHGVLAYLNEYFKTPLAISTFSWPMLPVIILQYLINGVAAIALFPLELMSKFSGVLSLSFRLFGNILAGTIVFGLWNSFIHSTWYFQIFGLVSGINIIILGFFGIFEGIIQAFVFTILTTTYLSLATTSQAEEPI